VSLTILNVAYPLVPVGPDTAGGAEQVLTALDRGIANAGHRSLVLAAEGSITHGTLIPSPVWKCQINDEARAWAAREHAGLISKILNNLQVDVIHFHGLDFFDYWPRHATPCVATLHLPPDWYPHVVFECKRKHTCLTCVSANQRRRCPASAMPIHTVSQGIDVDAFSESPPFSEASQGNYALALGRICPEKGFHFAIDAATKAGVPLLIGGQIYGYSAHEIYFEQQIKPRLTNRVRFLGPVGFRQKQRLLSAARCLLVPSTDSEMANAIRRIERLSREDCRKSAQARFSLDRMMEDYFRIYSDISRAS
jgi:glycosyltransferase involved in cell wall biosynthesis